MNLLVLFPRQLWTRKQSPVRRHAILALQRHDDTTVKISGQGWPDWRHDIDGGSVAMIEQLMPDADAVFWYKPLGTRGIPPLDDSRAVRDRWLTVESFNECWWPDNRAEREATEAGTSLVICHHANDKPQFRTLPTVHIPHCAEKSIFARAAKPWKKRDIDVLLCGVQSPSIYPLRARWLELYRANKLPGHAVHYERPPYRAKDLNKCDELVAEYATMLGRSKIILGCTSRYKYPLARFPEAAMAGAVHVSDTPEQAPVGYDKMICPVDPAMPEAMLIETVVAALDQAASMQPQEVAMELFTQECYASRFLGAIDRSLAQGPR